MKQRSDLAQHVTLSEIAVGGTPHFVSPLIPLRMASCTKPRRTPPGRTARGDRLRRGLDPAVHVSCLYTARTGSMRKSKSVGCKIWRGPVRAPYRGSRESRSPA